MELKKLLGLNGNLHAVKKVASILSDIDKANAGINDLIADVIVKRSKGELLTSIEKEIGTIGVDDYKLGIMFKEDGKCYVLFKYVKPGITKILTYKKDQKIEVVVPRDYYEILSNFTD